MYVYEYVKSGIYGGFGKARWIYYEIYEAVGGKDYKLNFLVY